MRLQEILNKISNNGFLLTVDGWCNELEFADYDDEKKQDYWAEYKNRTVESIAILTTNGQPELCISLKK